MLEYAVEARRIGAHRSEVRTRAASIVLDTDAKGGAQAFNPAELLLAALAGSIVEAVEHLAATLEFEMDGVEVKVRGVRQEAPPKLGSIDYELIIDTGETDDRLELLRTNLRKFGTVTNTIVARTTLRGRVRRKAHAAGIEAELEVKGAPPKHEPRQATPSETPPEYETWRTGP